jgi:seryl-tRNA synthetase
MFRLKKHLKTMDDLKQCIKDYRNLDNQRRELNYQVSKIREDMKCKEFELQDILKSPQFTGYDRLRIEDDGSEIKIQRQWVKPISFTQGSLQKSLVEFFGDPQKAKECFDYIVREHKKNSVCTEFKFTRVIQNENLANE